MTVALIKNVIIFGVDNSSSVHIDKKNTTKKYLSSLVNDKQGLDDATITAEDKYSFDFTESGKILVFSLQYNRSNSFLIVNHTKIYQFKAIDSEIPYS